MEIPTKHSWQCPHIQCGIDSVYAMPWVLVVEADEPQEMEEEVEEESQVDEVEEEEEAEGEGEGDEDATGNQSEPKCKKRKVLLNRKPKSQNRLFQPDWKKGRAWLQYSESAGMWCSICHPFRLSAGVIGGKSKRNALAYPTKSFRYRNVAVHENTNYHLLALGMTKKRQDPMTNMHIPLPPSKVPQAKALFHTVLFMARRGIAHHQMRALMDLQKANGVSYDMRYRSSYTPIVMHFLAQVARDYFRKQWNTAISKALMTDEVKVGDAQWLTTSARLFASGKFVDLPLSPSRFPGEERDATAISKVLQSSFNQHGICDWLDEKVVAFTTDGASVLLSGLRTELQKKAPGALSFYCSPHRTQRVDFDVTEVPKADRGNEEAMKVRKLANRLNKTLRKTASFFSVSTKRWAAFRKVAGEMGYHLAHGAMPKLTSMHSKRLLKFRCIQKTRFVRWKRQAAHSWLNNLPALQTYLASAVFPEKCRKRAAQLLRWSKNVQIIGGMVVYEAWACALASLSLSTQSNWAALPSLFTSVKKTKQRIQRLHETLEKFISEANVATMTYKAAAITGTAQNMEDLVAWVNALKQRTDLSLERCFDTSDGSLLWGASLFDRRTWPQDLKFDIQGVVQQKLDAVERAFPRAFASKVKAFEFVAMAQKLSAAFPLVRSKCGHIRACDVVRTWEFAKTFNETAWKPVLDTAIALCTVPVSQSSCERFNSVLKLVYGNRRQLLSAAHAADEIVVRTSVMPSDEMIHEAVRLWATTAERRTAKHDHRAAMVDDPESSSEGHSSSLSSCGSSDGSVSSSNSTTSSERASLLSDTSEGSMSHGSASLPVPPVAPEEPAPIPVSQATVPTECPWFTAKLKLLPSLQKWEAVLRKDGFNTKETITYLQVDDMAAMGIPVAVRRLLIDLKKQVASENAEATSSNQ